MKMKIYVGNLPKEYKDEDLDALFKSYEGYVQSSSKVIIERETGQSRGFGFVEFNTNESGSKAIQELNGKECGGRKLIVNEARPQKNERRGGGGRFATSSFNSRY
jgi:cold-inducible RNA-binding protein